MICLKKTNLWVMSCISLSFRQQLTHLSLSLSSHQITFTSLVLVRSAFCKWQARDEADLSQQNCLSSSSSLPGHVHTCTHTHTATHTHQHTQDQSFDPSPTNRTLWSQSRWQHSFSSALVFIFSLFCVQNSFFFQTSGKKMSKLTL